MSGFFPIPSRGRGLGLALALLVLGLAPGIASAAITATNVTAPSDPYLNEANSDLVLSDPANAITITGTTNSTDPASDTVDIYCTYTENGSAQAFELINGQALNGDGTFSYTTDKDNQDYLTSCRLRAVPNGTDPSTADLAPFTGPRWLTGDVQTYGAGGQLEDFYVERSQLLGGADYNSIGSCGLANSRVLTADGQRSDFLFFCNAYLPASFNVNRGTLVVDGRSAYSASEAYARAGFAVSPGAPALSFTRTVNPATGDLTITESEDLVFCDETTFEAGLCPSYSPTGLRVERRIVQSQDGRLITISDDFVSTDGRAHRVDALYEQDLNSPGGPGSGNLSYRIPWDDGGDAYREYAASDVVGPAPSSAPTVYVKQKSDAPDGSTYNPQGAITFSSSPNAIVFGANDYFYDRFVRPVPAGGRTNVTHVYSQGTTTAEVTARATAASDRFAGPAVTIDAPASGSTTTTPTVRATGTASDNVALTSFRVNGRDVAVGPDGRWSTDVPLRPGSNTITAVATDGSGNAGQAQTLVGFQAPAVVVVPTPMATPRVKPKRVSVSVRPRRDRRAPYSFRISGRVLLPAGATSAACARGRVSVQSKVGTKTVSTRRATLTATCRYAVRVTFRKRRRLGRGRIKMTVRFLGTPQLTAVRAAPVRVRAG